LKDWEGDIGSSGGFKGTEDLEEYRDICGSRKIKGISVELEESRGYRWIWRDQGGYRWKGLKGYRWIYRD